MIHEQEGFINSTKAQSEIQNCRAGKAKNMTDHAYISLSEINKSQNYEIGKTSQCDTKNCKLMFLKVKS